MRFRTKPVVIEAVLIERHNEHTKEIPGWLVEAIMKKTIVAHEDGSLTIKTLEGDMTGNQGDWLIQGVKGELYACKPDIFEATYEPA